MFRLQSNRIDQFPFEEYANCNTQAKLQEVAQAHRLSNYNSWMLPQILAYYGGWQIVYSATGLVDSRATAQQNIQTPWEIGLWRVVVELKRSSLVATQNRQDWAKYSMLTPLILAGVRQSQGTRYSQWDNNAHALIAEPLWEAMQWPAIPMTREEILQCRQLGLQNVSTGGQVNPVSRWCLNHQHGTPLGSAPALVGTMLTQIWCAHPTLRHPLMILDHKNWDHMPEPLLDGEVLEPKTRRQTKPRPKPTDETARLPWLD